MKWYSLPTRSTAMTCCLKKNAQPALFVREISSKAFSSFATCSSSKQLPPNTPANMLWSMASASCR